MALRLRVVNAHAKFLGSAATKVFGVHGGTVGRAEDNDWVLPDPDRYVSGHHARIDYREGGYWLADTSSNGTFVNDEATPLSERGPYQLQDGDRLRMGDFELIVTIDASNDFPPDNSAIVAYDGLASSSQLRRLTEEDIGEDLDVDALLGEMDSSNSRLTPVNAWGQAVEAAAVSRPKPREASPAARPAPQAQPQPEAKKPDDPSWHLATRRVDRYRNPLKPDDVDPSESTANGNGMQALFRGAGLDPSGLPAAVQVQAVQLAGQMLREMVLGLMDVQQVLSDTKSRLRIPDAPAAGALDKDSGHNPLQFSVGVDEALRKLFEAAGMNSSRYMGPLEAVRQSFHTLKVHHQATMAALQAAFQEFLSHLDPQELQDRFDRGLKRGGLLGATNKMKYWDLYSEFFQTLNQRQELPHVFVEEFARVYAEKAASSR